MVLRGSTLGFFEELSGEECRESKIWSTLNFYILSISNTKPDPSCYPELSVVTAVITGRGSHKMEVLTGNCRATTEEEHTITGRGSHTMEVLTGDDHVS